MECFTKQSYSTNNTETYEDKTFIYSNDDVECNFYIFPIIVLLL